MVCNFSQLNNKLFATVVNKDKVQNAIMIVGSHILSYTHRISRDVTTHESELFK